MNGRTLGNGEADQLKKQIRDRNAQIERIKIELEQKDRAIMQLQSELTSPNHLALLDRARTELQNQEQNFLSELEKQILRKNDESVSTKEALDRTTDLINSQQQDSNVRKNVLESQELYRSISTQYKNSINEIEMLDNQLKQNKEQGKEYYVSRIQGLNISEPLLNELLGDNQLNKSQGNKANGQMGHGSPGMSRNSSNFPPGSAPIALISPNGVPFVCFIPPQFSVGQLSEFVSREVEDVLNKNT